MDAGDSSFHSSRAGIEDSDLEDDDVDMLLAHVYFGDRVEEEVVSEAPLSPTPSKQEIGADEDSGTHNIRDDSPAASSHSGHDGESSNASESELEASTAPESLSEYVVLDSDGLSSDAEYTQAMDAAFSVSSDDSDEESCIEVVESDSGGSDSDGSVQLNVRADLDDRPVFRDGYLVTADDKAEERGNLWCINEDDRLRGMAGNRLRYYQKKINCSNCDQEGHTWRNCPKPKKKRPCVKCGQMGHNDRCCPDDVCFKCLRPGHRLKDCRHNRGYEQCQRCYMRGHNSEFCSDIWRQYHHTTDPHGPLIKAKILPVKSLYCYNCALKGHLGHECTKARIYPYVPPYVPFVAKYSQPDYGRRSQSDESMHSKQKRRSHEDRAAASGGDQWLREGGSQHQENYSHGRKRKHGSFPGANHVGDRRGSYQLFDDGDVQFPRGRARFDDANGVGQFPKEGKHKLFSEEDDGEESFADNGETPKKRKTKKRKRSEGDLEAEDVDVCPASKKKKKMKKKKKVATGQHDKSHGNYSGDSSVAEDSFLQREVNFQPRNASTPSHRGRHGLKHADRSFPQFKRHQSPAHGHQPKHSASFHGRSVHVPAEQEHSAHHGHDSYNNPYSQEQRSHSRKAHSNRGQRHNGSFKKGGEHGGKRRMTNGGRIVVNESPSPRGFNMSTRGSHIRQKHR